MMTVLVVGGVVVTIGATLLATRVLRARQASEAARLAAGDVANSDDETPAVVQEIAHGARGWEVFSRLLKQRIIVLRSAITDETAQVTIAQLLYLADEDPSAPICLYIDSPGGYVTASLAIRDTMHQISPPVSTIVMNQAAGTALMIAAHGAPGARFALPRARLAFVRTSATREDTSGPELARTTDRLVEFLAADTGQPASTVAEDFERARTFSPEEARAYGLIDEIYVRRR